MKKETVISETICDFPECAIGAIEKCGRCGLDLCKAHRYTLSSNGPIFEHPSNVNDTLCPKCNIALTVWMKNR